MVNLFNPATVSRRELINWTLSVLRKYNVKPRKKLSQNFIVNPHLISEIVAYTAPLDTVEVGCGIGTLSLALLTKVKRLICVEVDEKLCTVATSVVSSPRFLVINADARACLPGLEQLVSNVPYHITSDLLVKIARINNIKRAILTLQREVAERLLAKPGSRAYGKLTVLVRVLFEIRKMGIYSPSSFYPEPEVSHRVVIFERKKQYSEEVCALEVLTKHLFTQRRRLVERVLASSLGVKVEDLGSLGNVISGKRVFMLGEDALLELANTLRERGVIVCEQHPN